jgi:hypothetical protein
MARRAEAFYDKTVSFNNLAEVVLEILVKPARLYSLLCYIGFRTSG